MFVRMEKLNSEGKKIVKFVTDEIGKKLILKEKATLVEGSEKEHYEAEKAEADAESRKDSPEAYAKLAELSAKTKKDAALKAKIEKAKSQVK